MGGMLEGTATHEIPPEINTEMYPEMLFKFPSETPLEIPPQSPSGAPAKSTTEIFPGLFFSEMQPGTPSKTSKNFHHNSTRDFFFEFSQLLQGFFKELFQIFQKIIPKFLQESALKFLQGFFQDIQ